MNTFLTRHESEVKAALSGFDRVRFRGTLRWLANLAGMEVWLRRRRRPIGGRSPRSNGKSHAIDSAAPRAPLGA